MQVAYSPDRPTSHFREKSTGNLKINVENDAFVIEL
jgi:hypothetical protein